MGDFFCKKTLRIKNNSLYLQRLNYFYYSLKQKNYEEINDDRSNDADEYWRICTGR